MIRNVYLSEKNVFTETLDGYNTGADPGFDQGGAPDRDRPKTAILGPQFCRILVLGPHFWWSGGGPGPRGPPGSAPAINTVKIDFKTLSRI